MRVIAAAKDERSPRRSCASPATTRTSSKTGSVEPAAAGIAKPDWARRTKRPTVFIATLLPPAFGPERRRTLRPVRQLEIERDRVRVPLLVLAEDLGPQGPETTVQERVARAVQDEPFAELREHAADGRREFGAGLRGVHLREDLERGEEVASSGREARREGDEDAVDFLALLLERLGEGVVVLEDGERLDEERLPGARFLVHEPRHRVAPVRPHGEAVAAALLRDVTLGERVAMAPREFLELSDDFAPQALDRGAERVEARGRRVLHAAVRLEGRLALGQEVLERGDRAEELREVGELDVFDGHGRARALGALDEKEEVEEVLGREGPARGSEAGDEGCAFVHARERDRRPQGAAREKVTRDTDPARDLERIG